MSSKHGHKFQFLYVLIAFFVIPVGAILECTICEEGTYCYNQKKHTCPQNSTSNAGSTNQTDCTCFPGFYKGETGCEKCGYGYYCPGGANRFICPVSSTTLTQYESDLENCRCKLGFSPTGVYPDFCTHCQPGTYKDVISNGHCTECPSNTYLETTGAVDVSQCINCLHATSPSGSQSYADCTCNAGYVRRNGEAFYLQGGCEACNAGKFWHQNTCQECPKNTYSTLEAQTNCISCPAHSITTSTGMIHISACSCVAGYQSVADVNGETFTCEACEPGTFKNASMSKCLPCPAHTYQNHLNASACISCPENSVQPATGSVSVAECLCMSGYGYATTDLTTPSCQICTSGSFKNTVGNDECSGCPKGTYSLPSSLECLPCANDSFSDTSNSATCKKCPEHAHSLIGSTHVSDCKCSPGYTLVNGLCEFCPFGFYKEELSNNPCVQCPAGKSTLPQIEVYQTNYTVLSTSQSACKICPYHTFASVWQNGIDVVCELCPENSFSEVGSYEMSHCLCQSGYEKNNNNCVLCQNGTYRSGIGNEPCVQCPLGMVGASTYHGQLLIFEETSCKSCPKSTYQSGSNCLACPANSVSFMGSSSRDDCVCKGGYKAGTHGCTACLAGKYKSQNSNNVSCEVCGINSFSESGATACTSCQPNSESASGSVSRADCICKSGFINDNLNPDICVACPKGKFERDNQCVGCNDGFYYPDVPAPYFMDICAPCPVNSQSIAGSYSKQSCQCLPGFLNSVNNTCAACPENSYCPTASSVISCPQNSESVSGMASVRGCTCKSGFFGNASLGSQGCMPCTENNFCQGGAHIEECPIHSSTNGNKFVSARSGCYCNPGYFLNSDKLCQICPENSYCYNQSQVNCPPNSLIRKNGSMSVHDCECNVNYKMQDGVCVPCSQNEICAGASSVVACAEGAVVINGTCLCPTGFFCGDASESVVLGLTKTGCTNEHTCSLCPIGKAYCKENVKVDCHSNAISPLGGFDRDNCTCADGWFKEVNSDGVINCTLCPSGFYCFSDMKQNCLHWDENTITTDTRHFDRDHCKCQPGFFRLDKSDACKICPKDFFCPDESLSELPNVVACYENEYTNGEGSVRRSDCICDAGHRMSMVDDVVKCLPCDEGQRCQHGQIQEEACHLQGRVPDNDHSECVCQQGKFETNNFQCIPCQDGYIKDKIGNEPCRPCEPNTFATNKTHCRDCPANMHSIAGLSACVCNAPLHLVVDEQGQSSCMPCPKNYYYTMPLSVDSSGSCMACPLNSSSAIGSKSLADCVCQEGYIKFSSSTCKECPESTFQDGNVCLPCPPHTSSPKGSTHINNCTCTLDCQKKNWHPVVETCSGHCYEPMQSCQACQAGFVKDTFSTTGNFDKCEPCAIGTYQYGSHIHCNLCLPTRSTSSTAKNSIEDCLCLPGFEEIVTSPDFQTSSSASQNCTKCELGTFKTSLGNHHCSICPRNTFADQTGMLDCKSCAIHTEYIDANFTNDEASTDVSDCVCDKGAFLLNNSCTLCLPGSFKHAVGLEQCFFCGAASVQYGNHYLNSYGANESGSDSEEHCTTCPHFSGQDHNLISYQGQQMVGIGSCRCFPGYENFDSIDGCVPCRNYTYKTFYGNEACEYCAENFYFSSKNEECLQCKLIDDFGIIHSIAKNSIFDNVSWGVNEGDCVCKEGFYRSVSNCHECDVGYYRDFSTGLSFTCSACPINTFASQKGTVACSQCPQNSVTLSDGQSSLEDCRCLEGFSWNGTTCNACPPGFYKDTADTENQRYECRQCPDTTYATFSATVTCDFCGINMHSHLPRNSISTCECNPGFGGNPCSKCLYGLFSGGGTPDNQHLPCQDCPIGKTTILNASTKISDCLCRPGFGISPVVTPDSFTVTGVGSQAGAPILLIDKEFVLTVGQEVAVDWSATAPSHPFALSSSTASPFLTPSTDVVTQNVDHSSMITTITVHSADNELYYMCSYGHGFVGVHVRIISAASHGDPTSECEICVDGYFAPGFENVPCTHCGYGGVTHPELGADSFDACMCNHTMGLFEAPRNVTIVEVETILDASLIEFTAAAEDDFICLKNPGEHALQLPLPPCSMGSNPGRHWHAWRFVLASAESAPFGQSIQCSFVASDTKSLYLPAPHAEQPNCVPW